MRFFITLILFFYFSISLNANDLFRNYLIMKEDAYYYYENGQSDDAYSVVNGFIKEYPEYVRAQNLLAVLHYWDGDLKKSKTILLTILQKDKFKQSVALLNEIEKKEGKKIPLIVKKEDVVTSDVKYLLDAVKNNPNDIINRKVLAKYYFSNGQKQKAKELGLEIIKIDPDTSDVLVYIDDKPAQNINSITNLSKETKRAIAKLNYFYKYKKYNKFINLYNSLENNKIIMPTTVHVKALYSVLELKDYKRAESIFYMYKMPNNENIQEIKRLLESRVASN